MKLTELFWDYQFREEDLQALLNGEIERVGHLDRNQLYLRMLLTLGWYQIMSILPKSRLKEALSEQVIENIRYKDLREKYYFAKRLLSQ